MSTDTFATGRPAPAPSPSNGADMRCFTIIVDRRCYGLSVECIQTVFEINAITPVPLAPHEVLGLVNLRGKIATAVSLRRRLGADPKAAETSTLAVGVDHGGESFALVVDAVGDVLTFDRGTEIDIPSHLGAEARKFSSVHRLETQILPVLDIEWILALGTEGHA